MKTTRTFAAAAAIAALGLSVTACSASSGQAAQPHHTASTATTQAAPTTPPAPQYTILSKRQLKKAMPAVNDLPPGYSLHDHSAGADRTFCEYKTPTQPKVKVSSTYMKGAGLSAQELMVTLREYASPEDAKASYDALVKTLNTCHHETYQGDRYTYRLTSAPQIGDDTVGVTISSGNMTAGEDFTLVGPTMVSVGGGGVLSSDFDQISNMLRWQVASYKAAATK